MSTVPGCGNCDRPVQDGASLCLTCTDGLMEQLRAVPDLMDNLFITYAKQDRLGSSSSSHRGKLSEAPLPVRFDITRVIDALGNEVTTWARELVETHRFVVPELIRRSAHNGKRGAVFPISSPTVDSYCYAATWLADHRGHLRQHIAALDAYNALTDAIAAAELAMDRPEPQLMIGYCELCTSPLYALREDSSTKCERCGAYISNLAQRWDSAKLKLRGYPATAADIAGWVSDLYRVQVKEDTIRKWHQRGDLTPVDWVELTEGGERKVPRFRIGAVLDRAKTARPRKAG